MGSLVFRTSVILLMCHYHLVTLFPSQYNLPRAQAEDNKTRVATANNKIVIIDFTVENNQFVNRAAVTAKSTVSARLPALSILIKMRAGTATIIPKTPEPTLIKAAVNLFLLYLFFVYLDLQIDYIFLSYVLTG